MADYNRYHSTSEDSSDDNGREAPSVYSYAPPEQLPPPPLPAEHTSGEIYTRRVAVPLQVIQRSFEVKTNDDDEDDDEATEERRTTRATPTAHPARGVASVPTHAPERTVDDEDTAAQDRPVAPPQPVMVPTAVPGEFVATVPHEQSNEDETPAEDAGAPPHPAQGTAQVPRPTEYPVSSVSEALPPTEHVATPTYASAPGHVASAPVAPEQRPPAPEDHLDSRVASTPPLPPQPGFNGLPPMQDWNTAPTLAPLPPETPVAERPIAGVWGAQPDGGSPYAYGQAAHLEHVSAVREVRTEEAPETRDRRLFPVVLTAVGLEYFARKRADRKLEKRMNKTAEQRHHETIDANRGLSQQQEVFAAQQRKQTVEVQAMRDVQERMAATPLSYAPEQRFAAPPPLIGGERPLPPIVTAPEARTAGISAEQQAALYLAQQEQAIAEANAKEHTIHEKQDAWRRFKVDEHDREIAQTYGEAYHQERQQEIIRDRIADNTGGAGTAGLSGSVFGSTGGHPSYGSLPSGMTSPTLPSGQPTHVDPQHQLAASQKQSPKTNSNITNPWFWMMLILIVAVFFTAASL